MFIASNIPLGEKKP